MKFKKLKKKSEILLIGIVILFVTYVMFRLYFTTNMKINKFESIIGENQLKLIRTYQKGDKLLYYLDKSAQQSYELALYESIQSGFGGGCMDYQGYPLFNDDQKECYPDIKENIKSNFEDNFDNYFEVYPNELIKPAYDYYIIENSEFVAKSSEYLRMDIGDEDEFNVELSKIIYEEEKQNEPNKPEEPGDPIIDTPPIEEPTDIPKTKCQFLVDYAKGYLGCPYSLTKVAVLTPDACYSVGLTCATFVGSVVYYTLGSDQYPWGHGREKCEGSSVTKIGTDVSKLQPGDIFQTELRKNDGSFTAWGHTGMYVGRGYVSEPGGVFCHKKYTPDSSGDYIFLHSYGWENLGEPGVCYESYSNLFIDNIFVLTSYCRPDKCM